MKHRYWAFVVVIPLVVTTYLGTTIQLPLERLPLQYLSGTFTIITLALAVIVHEMTRRFTSLHGLQREANFIIRASMKRGLFDGLFLLNTVAFLGLAGFFILSSPTVWLNYWLFMMIGAAVVLSLNFTNDFGVWRRERTVTQSDAA
jgi:hypothetical protein